MTDGVAAFPKIVSCDDHLVEPPDLWANRLPSKYRDIGPRVVRERGKLSYVDGLVAYQVTDEGDPVDTWYYEDIRFPSTLPVASVGYSLDDMAMTVMTYDQMRPGCFQQSSRLADMDVAGIE